VLAVRKSIAEIPGVVHVVRRAFLDAALAGLLLTLVLGIPLSGRLVRRLRRLREAAFAVEHDSPEAVLPVDTARDEVGGLARTLASMQQRLRRQEEARRSFVATASHELRTPLTSLDGMLELLHEDLQDDDLDLADARELLDRARAQSRRLGRLAADLLDLSRIDAQVQLRSEPVELAELSRAVLAEFELGNVERSIHSSLSDAQDATWALGDPGSIAQRASPPASEIRVLVRHGDHASITVCDEGPGVPQEERDAIFQRFNRGRETAGQGGFGLGLAIGRELARRMGGDLVLEAQTPPGARFTLRLPVARGGRDPVPEPLGVV
jgi:signal transduction histidine kinase